MARRVVFCGPSGCRCGVAATSELWVRGLMEAGYSPIWLTHRPVAAVRAVEIDPVVTGRVFMRRMYGRPDDTLPMAEWRTAPSDLDPGALDGIRVDDLVVLDYSEAVIRPASANDLLDRARKVGARTAVRLHSQLLQGLDASLVDVFAGSVPFADAVGLDDSEIVGLDDKWAEMPHPCAPRLSTQTPAEPALVFTYGPRTCHRLIARALAGSDVCCVAIDSSGVAHAQGLLCDAAWYGTHALVRKLGTAAVIVLFYPPLPGVGTSSALGMALAAGRPVVVNDSYFLRHGWSWGGLCDETDVAEVVAKALQRGGEPWEAQETFYREWEPAAAARKLVAAATVC